LGVKLEQHDSALEYPKHNGVLLGEDKNKPHLRKDARKAARTRGPAWTKKIRKPRNISDNSVSGSRIGVHHPNPSMIQKNVEAAAAQAAQ
jgi:hypothetical protein